MKKEIVVELIAALVVMSFFLPNLTAADPIVYDGGGRRDPFISLLDKEGLQGAKAKGDFHIEGIIYDPTSGSMVLVNGDFYKQGQQVGEATIMSILKDRVVLLQNDEEKTLWIREEILPKGEKTNVQKKIPQKKH